MVAEIWRLWLQSGRPEIDVAMEQAVSLMGAGLRPRLADPGRHRGQGARLGRGLEQACDVLYMLGEHDRSLADIEHVLALEPRHFGALAGIGLIRIRRAHRVRRSPPSAAPLPSTPFSRSASG